MSKKNSEKEIEEAQQKVRGEAKVEKKPEQKKDSSEKKESKKEDSVEKTLTQEERELQEQKPRKDANLEDLARGAQPAPAELHGSQYVKELSHKPMAEIYQEIKNIYKTMEDKGYLSPVEQKQIEYFNSAVQRKLEDEEQGTYTFSEQAARAASVSQQLSSSMMGSYKGKKQNEMYRS